nr:MAG TPA: hypothetical protein [Caudoviricetes sp.]
MNNSQCNHFQRNHHLSISTMIASRMRLKIP